MPEQFRTRGGHRRYEIKTPAKRGVTIGYARVSSHDQKNDLATQSEVIKTSSKRRGINVSEMVTDIGSGMNTKKRGFLRVMNLIMTGKLSHLVLLHKDRLLRFGSDLVFLICKSMGVRVTIPEESPAQTCRNSYRPPRSRSSPSSLHAFTACEATRTKNQGMLNFAQLLWRLHKTPR